ncbi:bifunctional aspartate kinase/homoserine dehydrogenase I [Parashewanella curva]|uniref:Bifunctional aspartokinase/homoserine dehydrogenase n=1 Tax=Parashewanella curva TaxID=2338552 RepID=A0A3L8PX53_9GAMM|nr:bifunctional aspartate kinase/homoserine dehydrogenase I [Parashewanella curva]RLV60037.1 bifunctional aspartate kinase/homoserine dehydrogenase I [Parashewanella curva]
MKVLKFGGKSLANGKPLESALEVIKKTDLGSKIYLVLSARGESTQTLTQLIELAKQQKDYESLLVTFIQYQCSPCPEIDLSREFKEIERILAGVALLGEYSVKIKERLLAFGEIISCKTVTHILNQNDLKARFVDARQFIKTDSNYGEAHVLLELSDQKTKSYFKDADAEVIEVVTGFIASDLQGNTTTLGANGSNYSATLLANFLNASQVQNWTSVNGIYSANPHLVNNASIIRNLSYREANELANFGTEVLHAKTILPLVEKNIPIRILNSLNPDDEGTLINEDGDGRGVKAVTVIEEVALISLEGRGLLGKVGIDGRIFSALSRQNISVRIISQASSERGIGFIVDQKNAEKAKNVLLKEFREEIELLDIEDVTANTNVAVISVIGQNFNFIEQIYNSLNRNKITPYLLANTINGEHLSLVIKQNDAKKAANLIHSHIFGASKTLNVLLLGKGNVGSTLINQLLDTQQRLLERRNLKLNIFGVADSKKVLLKEHGIEQNWLHELDSNGIVNYDFDDVIQFVEERHLENVVCVDNTANEELVHIYPKLISNGFDIVASNKHANTQEYGFYSKLRALLQEHKGKFLYETNVGAGLPLIDTIKLLHVSGDKIKRIRGIFSGSLSFIFNTYSNSDVDFYQVLQQAIDDGLTEPDPREDLSGNDVGRKLLILARELDLKDNLEDVKIENLIPDSLREGSVETFLAAEIQLNEFFLARRNLASSEEALRYVGELDVENQQLEVKLDVVSNNTTLGSLQGSDSIFEIYTESYGENPLVIRGAGAGAQVTARGVYSDLLRLAENT